MHLPWLPHCQREERGQTNHRCTPKVAFQSLILKYREIFFFLMLWGGKHLTDPGRPTQVLLCL